ncbi:UDP-N-acetylmuramate dehydrogenase [Desulfohalovibrio reitneri]|uniref:UDP-N-acetylmuramate dehydrogenase n=1 Tax=Desulfohalovibrio reitneri TaxID=1307759 RepID=UPI0004A77F99|nr:UDP-N-acetylmuramate dehydrogenase [Desulfohalovibrio reitneri]
MSLVTENVSLSERTTLGMGGTALAEVEVRTEADLAELPAVIQRLGGRPFVLGAGSNLLAMDGQLDVVLLRCAIGTGPERLDATTVRVGGGVKLPRLLSWLAAQGLSGLEGLRGIPGSVGGAVAMNAGSWGVCLDDKLTRVRVWTSGEGARWLRRGQWEAAYRSFLVPGADEPLLVMDAELQLQEGDTGEIKAAMAEYFRRKKAVQPISARTCGCAFKNPEGDSAGRLLDKAGFRGVRVGGAGFSEMHANFLVNLGEGTASEALELLELAENAVRQRFGIDLEREVRMLP